MLGNAVLLGFATAILVLIPGPNVALIVANSLRYGLRSGLTTVAGTTAGVALQLVLVVIGLAAVIEFAVRALDWIRWLGVAYLIYLGIRRWRAPLEAIEAVAAAPAMFWRGCLIAALNPKTLLFTAAFLPQFLPAAPLSAWPMVVLAAVFLGVIAAGDALWALSADVARTLLQRYARLRHKLSGAFLVAAGVGLGFAHKQG